MLDGLMTNNSCKIYRRQTTVKDGTKAGDSYYLYADNEPCIFLPKVGESVPNDGKGRDIVINGEFRIGTEILSTDKIEYDGYDYTINEVQPKKDIITEIVQYYRVTAIRQLKSNTNNIVVK